MTTMTTKALEEAVRQVTAMVSANPPAIGRILCHERMLADARLIAPKPEDAYQGIPVSVNVNVPPGHLILMDRQGKIIGMVGPDKPPANRASYFMGEDGQ